MTGGKGHDTYDVDGTADEVAENLNEGFDRVLTTLGNYTLGANVEALQFGSAGRRERTASATRSTMRSTATPTRTSSMDRPAMTSCPDSMATIR